MAAHDQPEKLSLVVTVETVATERGLRIAVTPADETKTIDALRASLVFTVWREGPAVIRGSIAHGSGAIAYFQGNDALLELARALGLEIVSET